MNVMTTYNSSGWFYLLDEQELTEAADSIPIAKGEEVRGKRQKLAKVASPFANAFAKIADPHTKTEEELYASVIGATVLPLFLRWFTSKTVLEFIVRLLIKAAIRLLMEADNTDAMDVLPEYNRPTT